MKKFFENANENDGSCYYLIIVRIVLSNTYTFRKAEFAAKIGDNCVKQKQKSFSVGPNQFSINDINTD